MPKTLTSKFALSTRRLAVFCLLSLLLAPFSQATDNPGMWLDSSDQTIEQLIATPTHNLQPAEQSLPLTGGVFWHYMPLSANGVDQYVIDFQSTSVVGLFTHYIIASDNSIAAQVEGGIQSKSINPYFLRHGRDLDLQAGQYRVFTRIDTPFLLAQPQPKIYQRLDYIQSIKLGNAITMLGLGVFLALGVYYFVLGITRRQPTDYLYAIFILGNLIYNSTALNVFSDVFGFPVFYSIGFPIMASNIAYIAFVMALLGITRKRATKLHFAGLAAMVILASFWLIVPFMPNMSLEFARYGVAVFGLFGITSGIIMAIKGQKTARYYLIANVAFLIPGLMSIALQSLPNSTLFIEHLGLFAVAMEVVLLSLVLSYQLSVVYKEKSANLIATQEALAIADNAVKTKERFLANISHELRTPLNAIQGSVDLLSGQHISAEGKDHIEIIRHSSAFLLFLINDILDLAKLNADMLLIEKRAFNLRDMVTQICSIYGSSFTVNSKAEFKLIIDDNVPLYIYGDERRMEQVIANLLSNAFKFTDAGTVTFKLTTIDNGQYLKFSVQDSGIGIDPENLSSMFSAFTQADSSISRKYGGTGLGLRIASRIVELMGGEMSAASQPGQGSEFWFTVPLSIANETQATNTQTEVGSQDLTFPDLHVMVVDDNAVNLKVINAMLKRLETKVTAFNNAHDAVNFAEKDGVDLVIMDVQMPEVDGLTASQQLRESGFNKPIIAFTANASEKDQIACYEAGMNDILIKPIKLQNLIDSLRKWRTRS